MLLQDRIYRQKGILPNQLTAMDRLAFVGDKGMGALSFFRTPSLDYIDLIKASRQLCKSPAAGQLQFHRAIFNLLSSNQDDHSKNWAFLQADDGQWDPAPSYDVTYSLHPFNEHATAFGGYCKAPPLKVMQKLATSAGFSNWNDAMQVIEEVAEAISQFTYLAQQQGVSRTTVSAITKTLEQRKQENAALRRLQLT